MNNRGILALVNDLMPFAYKDSEVRTLLIDGVPWFVAADICGALGLRTNDVLNALDEDEKGYETVVTPGGPQEMAVINEPGLYSTILRSRKPEAKAFKRWVTHEVLPALRKRGTYTVQGREKPVDLQVAQYEERSLRRRERELAAQGLYLNRRTGQILPLPGVVLKEEAREILSQIPETVEGYVQGRRRQALRSGDSPHESRGELERNAAWQDQFGEK